MIELEAKLLLKREELILPETPDGDFFRKLMMEFSGMLPEIFRNISVKEILLQKDIYFNSKPIDMKATDQVLRNRQERLFHPQTHRLETEKSLLTYKSSNQSTRFKSREEIEFPAPPEIWDVFSHLGFFPSNSVKKIRMELKNSGEEPTFSLDAVEHLGYFLEMELLIPSDDSGENPGGQPGSQKDGENRLEKTIAHYELSGFYREKRSYLSLLVSPN